MGSTEGSSCAVWLEAPGPWCSQSPPSVTSCPSSMHRHSPEQILLTGTTMEADCQSPGSEDRAQIALCVWDPKMACFWGGIPKCSVPESKHHHVGWPERTLAGEGERCPAHTLLICTKSPFRVVGWQRSSWAFVSACAQNSNQAHWLPHKLATVTKSTPQTLHWVELHCTH